MKKILALTLFLIFMSSTALALPINVIDQQNTKGINLSGNEIGLGQSFTPTFTSIDAVEVVLKTDIDSSILRLDLFEGEGYGGSHLAQSNLLTITNSTAQTIHFDLLTSPVLIPGNFYSFKIALMGGDRYGALYSALNPYLDGTMFVGDDTPRESYDLVFTEGLHSAPVPEPATILLMGIGTVLVGFAGARAKKKCK